jgi:hypothetical protein
VVLRGPFLPKELDHVNLAGVAKCLLAHRHPPVRDDHRCVAHEAEQDQRHTRLPDVRESKREQESVRECEHAGANQEIGSGAAFREWEELYAESRDDQAPPAQPKPLEPLQPATEQIADGDGDGDDRKEEAHDLTLR